MANLSSRQRPHERQARFATDAHPSFRGNEAPRADRCAAAAPRYQSINGEKAVSP